jgi:hypothetical protein
LAQCAGSMFTASVTCSNPTCSQTVTMSIPNDPGDYGVSFSCLSTSCCATSVPECWFSGWFTCGILYAKLDDPTTRRHLEDLARTQDVMVASCDGNYHPLMALLRERPLSLRVAHKLPGLIGGGK